MSDEKPNISISGSTIQGGIANIGGTQTFQQSVTLTMGNLSATVGGMNAAPDDKAALQKLIAELEAALKQAPAARQADAEKIAKRTKEVVEEASAAQPDQDAVAAKANLLKKAAENVASVLPVVTGIAVNIVAHLLKFGA
jgi:ElaB/YqjD/DUF883 family membrane-anchored ribosome-binding protein